MEGIVDLYDWFVSLSCLVHDLNLALVSVRNSASISYFLFFGGGWCLCGFVVVDDDVL